MRRAALLAAAAALVLAGCAQPPAEPTAAPDSTGVAGATATPSPTPTAEPSSDAIDTSDWLEFRTAHDDASFRYPADWALITETATDDDLDRIMDGAELRAPNGQLLLTMADFVDIGGSCGGTTFPFEVLAEEPIDVPALDDADESAIATVAIGTETGRWVMGIGITGTDYLQADETCMTYFVSASSEGGVGFGTHLNLWSSDDDPLWSIDSLDDARAYMETDEYRTIIEILRSFETR